MKYLLTISLLLLFITQLSFAATGPLATVVKIKGSATKLLPGATQATLVSEGDQLSADTSLLTGTKSFIQIKFLDNANLSMAADSKIVLSEMSNDAPVVISLLKGRIRVEASRQFYVRTRTAAIGVRASEFQVIYNPDNHLTSLLTYKGEASIGKIDETTHQRLELQISEKTTVITRDADNRAPVLTTIAGAELTQKEEINRVLTINPVVVLSGQVSMSSGALKRPSLPVRMSPLQMLTLFRNRELNEKNILNTRAGTLVISEKATAGFAAQKAPLEGYYNPKTGEFAPRAGGWVDQTSGIYIAPNESSTLNDLHFVYVSDSNGSYDADTGQYLFPQGLTLDSKHGFILEKNAEVKPELLALREDMNRSISKDIVIGNIEDDMARARRSLSEKFIRNHLSITLSGGSEKLKLDSYDFESSDSFKVSALWELNSTNRFSPLLGLSYASTGYDDLKNKGHGQDSKSLISMQAGLKYALTNRLDLVLKASLDQAHHASETSANPAVYQLKRIVMTNLNLGASYEIIRSNRWSLMGEAFGHIGLRKRLNNLVLSEVSGFDLKLMPVYAIDDRKSVGIGLYTQYESSKVTGGATALEEKRTQTGLLASMNFEL